MYDIEIIKLLKSLPVFSLSDVAKITNNRNYAKVVVSRLLKKKIMFKIMRDRYTFYEDSMIYAPFVYVPSYISCASCLSYYGLISQIPNTIYFMTLKRSKKINNLIYIHTKYFFGFDSVLYKNIKIPMAKPEKAFIDSIGVHPLHVIIDAIDELNKDKLINYALKMNEIKRIGFLLENAGYHIKIPVKLSYKYIYLDPVGPKKGKRDKKWNLIVNF